MIFRYSFDQNAHTIVILMYNRRWKREHWYSRPPKGDTEVCLKHYVCDCNVKYTLPPWQRGKWWHSCFSVRDIGEPETKVEVGLLWTCRQM